MKNIKLIYLSMICLVLTVAVCLLLSKQSSFQVLAQSLEIKVPHISKSFPSLPILIGSDPFPILSSQAVSVIDLDSGVPLYEKDTDKLLLPASTTKIVTALVAMDTYQPGEVLKVKYYKVDGQKMGLIMGEEITAEDLLRGLLIYSANDAAEILAQNYCIPSDAESKCGREFFIQAMNEKAKSLNLTRSNFTNPAGLDGDAQYTTAKDLSRAASVAMQIPRFATIVGEKERVVKSIDGKAVHHLVSTNKLLGSVEGVLGVKTGWTENARENLVTYITRDNHKVVIVVLGSQDRFGETKELIDWIFANYSWTPVKYTF